MEYFEVEFEFWRGVLLNRVFICIILDCWRFVVEFGIKNVRVLNI